MRLNSPGKLSRVDLFMKRDGVSLQRINCYAERACGAVHLHRERLD